jgi:hypothetical protein
MDGGVDILSLAKEATKAHFQYLLERHRGPVGACAIHHCRVFLAFTC